MIVCVCHALNGRQVRAVREHGLDRVSDVFRYYDVPVECGKCANCMLDVLRDRDCFPWDRYRADRHRDEKRAIKRELAEHVPDGTAGTCR